MAEDELDQPHSNASTGDKHLVVVVHGVGDTAAGSTVAPFARAVAAATGRSLAPAQEVLWLPEGDTEQAEGRAVEPSRQVKVFPSHVERIHDGEGETVLAEVTWEDLSRISSTVFGTLGGMVRLIFGLGNIARHAADPRRRNGRPDPAAGVLQRLSNLVAYWLREPVAALTLFAVVPGLILIGIIFFSGGAFDAEDYPLVEDGWAVPILLSVSILFAAAGLIVRGRRGAKTFFLWLGLAGITYAALLALPRIDAVAIWTEEKIGEKLFARGGGVLFERSSIWGLAMVASVGLLAVWMLLTVVAWLVARLRSPAEYRPGLDAACAIAALSTGMWLVATATASAPLLVKLADSTDAGDEMLRKILPMYAIHGLGSILLVLAAIGTGVARWLWVRKTKNAASYNADRPAPRLLLGNWICTVLIVIAVAGPSILLCLNLEILGVPKLLEMFTGMNGIAIQFGAIICAVVVYFIAHLSIGLDLGLDIISYFRRDTSRKGGEPEFLLRKQIHGRLRTVLRTLVGRERPDRLTVVAHSQGTVIAIDVLADEESEALLAPLQRCDLVTMGSPFHHFYQHYLPNDYPPLKDARWTSLHRRVDRWVNIFRIDDFVGTHIGQDDAWPENCPVDPGGHTGYWSDRQVLEILRARKLV